MQLTRLEWTQVLPNRLIQLWLLAATVPVYCVLSMAIGNSLFVSYVGADCLPQAFVLIGGCSIPAYVLFSQVVDRYSRPQLFRAVLLGSIFIALGLRLLLAQDSLYVYYILLIAVFFQWDFHNNVLYPSLLTDYFTTLEYKRYAPHISIAQAVGTLLGGGLTTLLSHFFGTGDLLLCLPILFAIAIAQLLYLGRSQRQLTATQSDRSTGILDSLQTFPDLVQRHPLALFLAGSSFLLVIIYISSEFLWFNIYGDNFNDRALTSFLGFMRIPISVVQIAVIYGITRPLLSTLGVARLNPIYPLTTLASVLGLGTHFGLSAAIGLHINGDALYKAINLPVHQLNYNAIPREFIGRIRVLSDGFIYAIGLTLAGAMLWLCEVHLSLIQITWLVAGLTGILLLLRLPMGQLYASGLEEMIRSNSINLDEFDTYAIPLSPQSREAVRALLTDRDRYTQLKGLELAARMNQPEEFLTEVEASIPEADTQVYGKAIALFSDCSNLLGHFQQQLQNPALQAFALELLLINQYRPSREQIETWLESPQQELQVLGAVAQTLTDPASEPTWPSELDGTTARIITRIVAYSNKPSLSSLIPEVILTQSSADVIQAGLEALLPLTQSGDTAIAAIASAKLDHPDPMVRMAAFDLLRVTGCPQQLAAIGASLGDPDPRVRQRVAKTLAAYGRPGLAVAKEHLAAPQDEVVDTAIAAIGSVRTRYASNLLFDHLAPIYKQLARTRKWQQQIPSNDPRWQPFRAAIADYHDRSIQKVLYVLSALGHARTVNTVNRLLAIGDRSELENALEALASLPHRRFVMPLMPLLEEVQDASKPTSDRVKATPQWLRTKGYRLLLEALESKDRWLRTGALIALSTVPSALVNDPDPFVKQIASQIFGENDPPTSPANTAMNRLLLLKNVPLFKNLSLDELLLIDKSLEQTQALAGETIFAEGDWGTHLYIIADGSVQSIKDIGGIPREIEQLTQGQYFGEVALFDDAPRWNGAIAIADCTLLKLGKSRFLSLIAQRPHIILEICRFLSQRLRETDKHQSRQALSISAEATESTAESKALST
ncbi:cyclic nucleotide-binding domain-containing protein [Synechococcus sp. PCC 7336]|uniref:cyclic nucleotide-binding domain-containing protein n=1 Tax=Synechococcus sp. PCC 7336 TaxID=195250 RepID=UPI0003496209|nr:cyclic nucleotide-binding domain-containing protein [Synechococcus sp. PCC 7336]